ncbi:MAG: helix-turn-helix family protein [Burkholderia sp.]|jgi:predicted DNA-binding mobile mystery protein A|nr:helix-turn-helix family protein [Burkholderia sp.]
MDVQELRLSQVDRALKHVSVPPRPQIGWIQAIRTALGMTTRQLASRIGVTQSTLAELEKSEANDKITLQSLRRVADALDCEVQYVLVPRDSLKKRVENQAESMARSQVARVFHSMRLEDQAPTANVDKKEISRVRAKLLSTNWKRLWE